MKLEYIPVGRIVNAHGTRGEVRLQPDGLSPDFLTRFKTFYLDGQPLRPTANHVHKSFVLLKLPGVDDMNTALSYKGKTLSIRRADAPLSCWGSSRPWTPTPPARSTRSEARRNT